MLKTNQAKINLVLQSDLESGISKFLSKILNILIAGGVVLVRALRSIKESNQEQFSGLDDTATAIGLLQIASLDIDPGADDHVFLFVDPQSARGFHLILTVGHVAPWFEQQGALIDWHFNHNSVQVQVDLGAVWYVASPVSGFGSALSRKIEQSGLAHRPIFQKLSNVCVPGHFYFF